MNGTKSETHKETHLDLRNCSPLLNLRDRCGELTQGLERGGARAANLNPRDFGPWPAAIARGTAGIDVSLPFKIAPFNASIGRKADLQEPVQERLESAPYRPLHREREYASLPTGAL